VVGLVTYIVIHEGNKATELEEALIENCQQSPVRETLTEILAEESEVLSEEIKESEGPLLAKIAEALHITLAEAKEITAKSNAKKEKRISKKKERIDQIEPSDCESQYK